MRWGWWKISDDEKLEVGYVDVRSEEGVEEANDNSNDFELNNAKSAHSGTI